MSADVNVASGTRDAGQVVICSRCKMGTETYWWANSAGRSVILCNDCCRDAIVHLINTQLIKPTAVMDFAQRK